MIICPIIMIEVIFLNLKLIYNGDNDFWHTEIICFDLDLSLVILFPSWSFWCVLLYIGPMDMRDHRRVTRVFNFFQCLITQLSLNFVSMSVSLLLGFGLLGLEFKHSQSHYWDKAETLDIKINWRIRLLYGAPFISTVDRSPKETHWILVPFEFTRRAHLGRAPFYVRSGVVSANNVAGFFMLDVSCKITLQVYALAKVHASARHASLIAIVIHKNIDWYEITTE